MTDRLFAAETVQRFLRKVDLPDAKGCHKWLGAYSQKRHFPPRPVFWLGGTYEQGRWIRQVIVPAFRVALALHDGVPLTERVRLFACHKVECSNPACVNPLHGYWGTEEQNRWDRYGAVRDPYYQLQLYRREI